MLFGSNASITLQIPFVILALESSLPQTVKYSSSEGISQHFGREKYIYQVEFFFDMSKNEDWIIFDVDEEMVSEARSMGDAGDEEYKSNLFIEKSTDLRWVGFLGELCFGMWIKSLQIPSVWHKTQGAGNTDFSMLDTTVGIKTVKRKVAMKPYYEAQISERHSREPSKELFFCCYEMMENRLLLLGGMEKRTYLQLARFYGEGEFVHPNYQIRKGHSIYNLEVSKLIPPAEWIMQLQKSQLF